VFDSDPYEEYVETLNKLKANMTCIESAEVKHWEEQQDNEAVESTGTKAVGEAVDSMKAHVDLAAG